jgi:CBS domain-containing protein
MDETHTDTTAGRTAGDVMVTRPKTLPVEASVADARDLFQNSRVLVALLVDSGRHAGELGRDDIPADASGEAPAIAFARTDGERCGPELSVHEALQRLETLASERLAVVGPDGELLGLLCYSRRDDRFCVEGEKG